MLALDQKQYEVISQYVKLLKIVEEGFGYINEQYRQEKHDAGDRMLGDILIAFSQFEMANQTLMTAFGEEVLYEIQMFKSIIEIIEELEVNFYHEDWKKDIILSKLIPAFNSWSILMRAKFEPYLLH
ncbi:hypothetical protein [Pseudalkalibacillus salsuginis]|uniref:hypothetical protein n=1 Tax=Pseudalkalibacillus salsuginis TaxID=2910972 RepID=UPI001F3E3929|nr:hypothetical protein [Pseudalkalibacillus salsuginis]MCF6410158.1 hypothetical protein [Pseudalkalibacillus salsuginis]